MVSSNELIETSLIAHSIFSLNTIIYRKAFGPKSNDSPEVSSWLSQAEAKKHSEKAVFERMLEEAQSSGVNIKETVRVGSWGSQFV